MGAWIETRRIMRNVAAMQSHPVWVRGLKLDDEVNVLSAVKSHPVWVRGLKPTNFVDYKTQSSSHPVWVRGLKLAMRCRHRRFVYVAPRVGAWIETYQDEPGIICNGCRTPCGCVD